jgi:hypothetical protein
VHLLPVSPHRRTFITVAPSFVIVCLPFSSTINKSPPYGPKVGFIVAWTAKQAFMFDTICPLPCELSVPALIALAGARNRGNGEKVGLLTFFEDDNRRRLASERHFEDVG